MYRNIGVPQESLPGPKLFLILHSNTVLRALEDLTVDLTLRYSRHVQVSFAIAHLDSLPRVGCA